MRFSDYSLFLPLLFCLATVACKPQEKIPVKTAIDPVPELPKIAIVPMPVSITPASGEFLLRADTRIIINDQEIESVAQYFADLANRSTGFRFAINQGNDATNAIHLRKVDAKELGTENKEAYKLNVESDRISIKALSNAGLFYGLQSLRQLLPAEFDSPAPVNSVEWKIPAVLIEDQPLYGYRGMHLDVSRHFMPVWFIKRYLDLLAFHKMNYFHWHLTDDQGWRIPIDAYPLLIEKSSWRKNTIIGHTQDRDPQFNQLPESGFYTKEQIRDIVAYAKERQITIIPEIDIPGHASTILHAYPELGCGRNPSEVKGTFGIFQDVLCPHEKTFAFLQDVFTEVAELFPGEYIHLGGDEVLKDQWQASAFCQQLMQREGLKDYHQLQSYFIHRVSDIITGLNKKVIGWNEILDGGVAENATIMSWQGIEAGITAAKMRHDAIMAPWEFTYFDAFQSRSVDEPLAIHGLTSLKKVYSYNPMPTELKGTEYEKHILGAQGQLWIEYIPTPDKAEYMVLPRMSALAEVIWSPLAKQNWQDFYLRLPALFARFDTMGINVSRSIFTVSTHNELRGTGESAQHLVSLNSDTNLTSIRYTTDGSQPNHQSPIYTDPFEISGSTLVRIRAQDKYTGHFYYETKLRKISHKAVNAKITFLSEPSTGQNINPAKTLVDGISSRDQIFQPDDWATFWGEKADFTIELATEESVSELKFAFNPGKLRQMFPPKKVELFSSSNGQDWTLLASLDQSTLALAQQDVQITFNKTETRYLRLVAEIHDPISDNPSGTPNTVPLYMDEIIIK
jgi:hexosaminidase